MSTKPRYKTVFVESVFGTKIIYKNRFEKTGGKKSIFFGALEVPQRKKVIKPFKTDDMEVGIVDTQRLQIETEAAINALADEGYEVVTVTPITSSTTIEKRFKKTLNIYSLSYTSGNMIYSKLTN